MDEIHEENTQIAPADNYFLDNNLLSPADPLSVVNLAPAGIRDALIHLPKNLLTLPDKDLIEVSKPDLLLRTLRRAFWQEYTISARSRRPMNLKRIINSNCTAEFFCDNIVSVPNKIAFLLRPPMNEADTVRSIMENSLERVSEFLTLPATRKLHKKRYDKDGNLISEEMEEKIDTAFVGVVQKIAEAAVSRIHGSVLQRVAIKHDPLDELAAKSPIEELRMIEAVLDENDA